jgi:hypothetical protein
MKRCQTPLGARSSTQLPHVVTYIAHLVDSSSTFSMFMGRLRPRELRPRTQGFEKRTPLRGDPGAVGACLLGALMEFDSYVHPSGQGG